MYPLILIFVVCYHSIQEQREERHAIKRARGDMVILEDPDIIAASLRSASSFDFDAGGSFPRGGKDLGYVYGTCASISNFFNKF